MRRHPGGRAPRAEPRDPRLERRLLWLVFAVALATRLLFWQSTSDAAWPGSASYKGDAWTWLEHASALRAGEVFELGVPIRPPGMAWILDSLWAGGLGALSVAQAVWCALGALAVALFQKAATRSFGVWPGLVTGLLCAGSSGLMMLSTSLNNETPYLVLLALVLLVIGPARRGKRPTVFAAWGALNALACLVRVEHALFFAMALCWLAWEGWSAERSIPRRGLVAALLAFGLALVPWHLKIWSSLREFNSETPVASAATEQVQGATERRLAYLVWEAGAEEARDRLPAFIRRPTANFVAATVAHRGRVRVSEGDFALVDEAFGYLPRPLAAFPFVVSTGGLNFALANHGSSAGGFDPAPLEAQPPLSGGADLYPAELVRGLPPPQFAFTYPGHLRLINEGYSIGLGWIVEHPGAATRLMARKLGIFWRGASLGVTGYNMPLSAGGLRRPVDLATPEGTWPTVWRLALLAGGLWGGLLAWRRRGARPWLLFLASKVIVSVAFYGYARQGASVIPVVALVLALAIDRPQAGWRPRGRAAVVAATLTGSLWIGVELARFLSHPELVIDGRSVAARALPDPRDHDRHTIEWR